MRDAYLLHLPEAVETTESESNSGPNTMVARRDTNSNTSARVALLAIDERHLAGLVGNLTCLFFLLFLGLVESLSAECGGCAYWVTFGFECVVL